MRLLCAIFVVAVATACVGKGEDQNHLTIITLSGSKYENATVTRVEPEAIVVMHASGVARIPFTDLSNDLQTRFGYDPAKVAALNAERAATAAAAAKADAEREKRLKEEQERILQRRARKLAALQRWARANVMFASREDQLRAALSARYLQKRGGRPLSAAEFQFLDEKTRISIILYSPELLPPEILDQ